MEVILLMDRCSKWLWLLGRAALPRLSLNVVLVFLLILSSGCATTTFNQWEYDSNTLIDEWSDEEITTHRVKGRDGLYRGRIDVECRTDQEETLDLNIFITFPYEKIGYWTASYETNTKTVTRDTVSTDYNPYSIDIVDGIVITTGGPTTSKAETTTTVKERTKIPGSDRYVQEQEYELIQLSMGLDYSSPPESEEGYTHSRGIADLSHAYGDYLPEDPISKPSAGDVITVIRYRIDDEPPVVISLPVIASRDDVEHWNEDVKYHRVTSFRLEEVAVVNLIKSLLAGGSTILFELDPDDVLVKSYNHYDLTDSILISELGLARAPAEIHKALEGCGMDLESL